MPSAAERSAFVKFAWFFAFYLIGVILFGAWVRITHSGAGCGSHWPTCQGEIIPVAPNVETLIEYTHRLTSGLCGFFGLVLVVWARRFERRVFRAALLTLVFILVEAGIGAGLVLRELVADDDSVARAAVVSLHLANTLLLMSCAALTAWWGGGRPAIDVARDPRAAKLFGTALLLLILAAMSGAVTALGDTLFPIEPTLGAGLFAKIRDDLSPVNHFLVRLRVWHPFVAGVAAAFLFLVLVPVVRSADRSRWTVAALALTAAGLGLGVLNVALAAPGWLQIIHLLTAHLLWMSVLLGAAERLREPAA